MPPNAASREQKNNCKNNWVIIVEEIRRNGCEQGARHQSNLARVKVAILTEKANRSIQIEQTVLVNV